MDAAELTNLILDRLVRLHGGSRGSWRRVVGGLRVYPTQTHPHCNWDAVPSGTVSQIQSANAVVDHVRELHPIAE